MHHYSSLFPDLVFRVVFASWKVGCQVMEIEAGDWCNRDEATAAASLGGGRAAESEGTG